MPAIIFQDRDEVFSIPHSLWPGRGQELDCGMFFLSTLRCEITEGWLGHSVNRDSSASDPVAALLVDPG